MKPIFIFSLIIFLFIVTNASSQEASAANDTLIQKLDSIDSAINNLKQRITDLEKSKEKRRAKKGNYKVRANWLALEKGMDKKQVLELLGEPGKKLSGFGEYWYYPDSFGGRVEFDSDEKVNGWSEP